MSKLPDEEVGEKAGNLVEVADGDANDRDDKYDAVPADGVVVGAPAHGEAAFKGDT